MLTEFSIEKFPLDLDAMDIGDHSKRTSGRVRNGNWTAQFTGELMRD